MPPADMNIAASLFTLTVMPSAMWVARFLQKVVKSDSAVSARLPSAMRSSRRGRIV